MSTKGSGTRMPAGFAALPTVSKRLPNYSSTGCSCWFGRVDGPLDLAASALPSCGDNGASGLRTLVR